LTLGRAFAFPVSFDFIFQVSTKREKFPSREKIEFAGVKKNNQVCLIYLVPIIFEFRNSQLTEEQDDRSPEEKAHSDKMLRIYVIIFFIVFLVLIITGVYFLF